MFRAADLRDHFGQRPFQPTRLVVSEGLRYDIYHPDGVIVTERDIMIGMPQRESGAFYNIVRVALVHVVAVEPLPAVPAGGVAEADA